MRHDAHSAARRRRVRLTALLACAALAVPAAAAPEAGAKRKPPPTTTPTSTTATVPSCAGLTWTTCSQQLTKLGFTNFERALDPYNNCVCGAGGVWRIIDDRGERIEGLTVEKTAHFLVQTNPDL